MRVFISSTSEDLKDYRRIAEQVVLDAQWIPVGMEHFPNDPRPIVRLCQEEVAKCNLVLLLQAFRRGWVPTADEGGDGQTSVTGWEIKAADQLAIPVLAFLASEDWPGRLWERDHTALEWVETFRGGLNRTAKFFDSETGALTQFRALVRESLALYRERLAATQIEKQSAPPGRQGAGVAPPEIPSAYRQWVKKQYGGVDLLGLQLKKGRPPSLSAIYVPQTTNAGPSRPESAGRRRGQRPGIDVDMFGRARERHTLALDRLTTQSLYISGAPGTGKSTFCRWVAWLVAEGEVPAADVPAPTNFVEDLDDRLKGRLPLLLRLREFWEWLPRRTGASLTVTDLENAIGQWVDDKRPIGLDSRLFRAHLAHGSALLVLDGMDEVPISSRSNDGLWHPRQQLLSALADACPLWCEAGNRLLLSSRPYGLSEDQAARTTLAAAPLMPLPRELQQLLAHRWFAVLSGERDTGAETAADLFANIESQPWLVELAVNPLLLTAMCIVFDEGKRLPQDKHELYERVVATVLFSRYLSPAEIDQTKRELGVIAYGMHTGAGMDVERVTPKAEATFHEVDQWLQDYRQIKDYSDRSETTAFEARDALLSRSGLFVPSGEDRAGFSHLSFQEFFAAQRSFTVDEARLGDVFLRRAAAPEWRNTLAFLFGRLVATFPEPMKAIDLLETRLSQVRSNDTGLLLVLADAAQVLTGKGITLRAERLQRLQQVLLDAMTGVASAAVRADVGSALGRLGDARFRPERWSLPDEALLGFIRVEAGPFPMGSDPAEDGRAQDDELPQHIVELPDYFFARYPVTVAQFLAFVEDSHALFGDPDALRGVPNHPVTWVSFHEAIDYSRWLTDKLKGAEWTPSPLRDRLADGWVIMPPNEAQWEKAARGTDGRIYPWGNEFDASNANGLGRLGTTSAVGLFPSGVSPSGALDMSGNVWEWTRSLWGENSSKSSHTYPYDPEDETREDITASGSVLRVLRGGSFSHSAIVLRAANRLRHLPGYRDGRIGFRLVLSRSGQ